MKGLEALLLGISKNGLQLIRPKNVDIKLYVPSSKVIKIKINEIIVKVYYKKFVRIITYLIVLH